MVCRVLGLLEQRVKRPVSAREAKEQHLIGVLRRRHADDPEGECRVLADGLHFLECFISERWLR